MVGNGRKKPEAAPEEGVEPSMAGTFGRGRAEEKRWRELLKFDEALARQSGIRLLTPEARVLLHLRLEGAVPVTSALPIAGTSYRGFYTVIERLKKAGLVATVKDPDDQRVRRLSLEIGSVPASKS
jgi:DNA-binding MarR family transcriptional regulator